MQISTAISRMHPWKNLLDGLLPFFFFFGCSFHATTFSCDPCHRLVLADQHRQTNNFQVHLAAAAAYNAVLAVERFRRTVVLLVGSFVGIDIRHVHSHC